MRGVGLLSQRIDEGEFFYLHNAHGDVVQRTDFSGGIAKTYDYDAFGVEQGIDQTDPNPFRYCGEYFDKESETVYLRARYYCPGIGCFTSEDVARDGLNWYTYCENNPVNRVDPFGLDSYILYEPEDDNWEKMELMRKELYELYGTDIHFIAVSSGDKFTQIWNGVGEGDHKGLGFDKEGNAVSVDATILLFHGDENGIGFKMSSGGWAKDDLTLAEIGNLNEVSMDTSISFTCLGGSVGGVTNSFYNRQSGINQIIGADAGVSVNVNKTTSTSGMWWWKKTTTVSSLDIFTGTDVPTATGFKLYQRNSKEGVDYLGGLGYHFTSLTDLITMARGYK